jgi:hypothetical protein
MWMWLNIWWREIVNQECISFFSSLHEMFCSNKQGLGAFRPSWTIEIPLFLLKYLRFSFFFQILHAFIPKIVSS